MSRLSVAISSMLSTCRGDDRCSPGLLASLSQHRAHPPAGPVEPGAKPILCFINTKSGPQMGKELRRKFLRILNPLQARFCCVIFLCILKSPAGKAILPILACLTSTCMEAWPCHAGQAGRASKSMLRAPPGSSLGFPRLSSLACSTQPACLVQPNCPHLSTGGGAVTGSAGARFLLPAHSATISVRQKSTRGSQNPYYRNPRWRSCLGSSPSWRWRYTFLKAVTLTVLMRYMLKPSPILKPQVVELPRERPERALALFADVPGLRLLVVGGDGTVGWVLSCLDALQAARQAAQAHSPWLPPPIAVLPLGTGAPFIFFVNPVFQSSSNHLPIIFGAVAVGAHRSAAARHRRVFHNVTPPICTPYFV